MLTLEERERRAYADGDVTTAAVLADAIELNDERIDELEHAVRSAEDEAESSGNRASELEDEIATAARDLEAAEQRIKHLEAELAKINAGEIDFRDGRWMELDNA